MEKIFVAGCKLQDLGEVWLAVSQNGLIRLNFPSNKTEFVEMLSKDFKCEIAEDPQKTVKYTTQLVEYSNGTRTTFDLPIDWVKMGDFQRKALEATMQIPFGGTLTYKQIAQKAGKPNAARAAGRAEATNPIPLVIPCHRVLGSDGKLHGYGAGAGLKTKTWLLEHEQRVLAKMRN